VRERLPASGRSFAYVVSGDGVLLGRLRGSALVDAPDDAPAEQLMQSGPSTVRASETIEALGERMHRADITTLPVTTPEGVLLGTVFRADVRSELGTPGSQPEPTR
jgi:Mg/Co/Ni transporter MgtE